MSLIDTSQWKEFSLKNLGFVCFHGQRLNQSNREEGKIPFVTAGFQNHGVTQYIGNNRPTYHKAITIDMFGNCFFQPDDCAGDDNVYFFVNDKVSDFGKIFISACIVANISEIYSYAKQFRQQNANALTIKLPATPSGAPNWAYMDSFMGKILEEEEAAAEQLAALASEIGSDGHFLDVREWKTFCLTDLFVMKNTKSIVQQNVVFDSGDVPYVTSQAIDNGVAGYISCPDAWLEQGNCLLIGGKTSTVFYQALDFCSNDSHNIACYAKESISDKAYLFLQSILSDFLRQHYSWGNSLSMKRLVSDEIYLPVTVDGQPDWAWMEQYMQQQVDKVEPLSEHLSKLVQ